MRDGKKLQNNLCLIITATWFTTYWTDVYKKFWRTDKITTKQ